jgi:hypothetical protein
MRAPVVRAPVIRCPQSDAERVGQQCLGVALHGAAFVPAGEFGRGLQPLTGAGC